MSRQFLKEFIQTYKEHPCLWKFSSKEHSNRKLREAAYDRLVKVAESVYEGATRDFVAKKISSLRGTYRKEMKKVEQSVLDGGGQYVPKLWYFEMMSFIRDDEYGVTKSEENVDKQVLVFEPVKQVKEEFPDNPLVIDEGSEDSLSGLVIDESSDNCSSVNTKEETEKNCEAVSEESQSLLVNEKDIELLPDIQSRAFGNNGLHSEQDEPDEDSKMDSEPEVEPESHLKRHLLKDLTKRQYISAKIKKCILEKQRNNKQEEKTDDDSELFQQFKTVGRKRGRGRPPKSINDIKEVEMKRRRGRPRKYQAPKPIQYEPVSTLQKKPIITYPGAKRKPGRPRKVKSVDIEEPTIEELPTVLDTINDSDSDDTSSSSSESSFNSHSEPVKSFKGIKVKKIIDLQERIMIEPQGVNKLKENGLLKIVESASTDNEVKQINIQEIRIEEGAVHVLDSEKSNPTEIYKNILNEFDAFVAQIDAGVLDKVPKVENGSPEVVSMETGGFNLEPSTDLRVEKSAFVDEDKEMQVSIPEVAVSNAKKRNITVDSVLKESDIAESWHKRLRTMRHEQVELAEKLIDQVLMLGCNDKLTHGTSIKFL